jgi:hypothetical protein
MGRSGTVALAHPLKKCLRRPWGIPGKRITCCINQQVFSFPPGVPFKPLFQGQTYLATYTKTGLILLILELSGWIAGGELKHGEDIQEGIENTPKTFLRLFEGKNVGKQLFKIAEPPL